MKTCHTQTLYLDKTNHNKIIFFNKTSDWSFEKKKVNHDLYLNTDGVAIY